MILQLYDTVGELKLQGLETAHVACFTIPHFLSSECEFLIEPQHLILLGTKEAWTLGGLAGQLWSFDGDSREPVH